MTRKVTKCRNTLSLDRKQESQQTLSLYLTQLLISIHRPPHHNPYRVHGAMYCDLHQQQVSLQHGLCQHP